MNEETIEGLKQFIANLVRQETSELRSDIKELDSKLSAKMDDLAHSVAEAVDTTNEAIDSQLKDHEQRISRLETA
jgi:hypothetical protein